MLTSERNEVVRQVLKNGSMYTHSLRALYGFQIPDVDKSVRVWYKDGLMTFYTSNSLSHITEYGHNTEEPKR